MLKTYRTTIITGIHDQDFDLSRAGLRQRSDGNFFFATSWTSTVDAAIWTAGIHDAETGPA